MSNQIMFWATVLSPIVGVIAIIVALIIAHGSSKDVKSQIDAINKQIDIFIAAQNPSMMETKKYYENQLKQLDSQINEVDFKLKTARSPFYGRGPKIDDIEQDMEYDEYRNQMDILVNAKKEIENRLASINLYMEKVSK